MGQRLIAFLLLQWLLVAGFGMGTGVQVLRVGPVRNVFHSLVQGFGSWEEAYAWLREMV